MTEPTKRIRLALVDDHRMLLGALTEWIRQAAADIDMVVAVSHFKVHLAFQAAVRGLAFLHMSGQ